MNALFLAYHVVSEVCMPVVSLTTLLLNRHSIRPIGGVQQLRNVRNPTFWCSIGVLASFISQSKDHCRPLPGKSFVPISTSSCEKERRRVLARSHQRHTFLAHSHRLMTEKSTMKSRRSFEMIVKGTGM